MDWKIFLPLLFCAVLGIALGENTYVLYVPKVIRPGFNIQPAVSILSSPQPVRVTVTLTSSDDVISLTNQAEIVEGSSATINLGQVPRGYAGSQKFTMTVNGVNTANGETLFTNTTSDFTFADKSLSIFIQTDKAIYQPGQTIKFRAVVLKPDLRPLVGNTSFSIKDPKGNTILFETDVPLEHGVAGDEFALSKDALVGDWKITFESLGYKEEMTVEVKLYKLPKFKVELEVPTYIYPESPVLSVTLKATYTYGKPVKGKAFLKLKLISGGIYYDVRPVFFGPNTPQKGEYPKEFPVFDGEAKLDLSIDTVKKQLGWNGENEGTISVTGSVTDGLSKVTINQTAEIDVKKTHIKVEALYKPNTIKPGLFYTAYIKVSEQDGKPLMESDRLATKLMVDASYRKNYSNRNDSTTNHTIPPDGVVVYTVEAPETDFANVHFNAYIQGRDKWSGANWEVSRAESPSNSYLQITTSESTTVSPGDLATVTIRTTNEVASIRIMTLSRGAVLRDETITGTPAKSRDHSFTATHDMIPGVQLLVSYVRPDGEIVADYIKLTVNTALQNQVTVTSSATRVDAGTDVSIKVQTSGAGSYVGARAIDQSVLLLKSGNDISQERVVTDLNKYGQAEQPDYWYWWWWYPVPSGAKDASEVFSEMDMIVLTDALVYKKEPDYLYPVFFAFEESLDADIAPVAGMAPVLNKGASSGAASPAVTPRTFFPETWLWEDAVAGADGSTYFNTTAPDTITSWILSVFSVSDQYGLGLADSFKITVFRQFFVSLNLPLKITRNETIVVQAIVFNYFDEDLTAQLTLVENGFFELIRPGDDPVAAGPIRTISVAANGAASVKFPLRMLALGEVPITVSAVSERAGDALTRKVYVRPEGVRQCYAASTLINRASRSEPDTLEDLEIRIPAGIVQGSENVKLSIYGDILGNTFNNLGRLLRTPGGCGEQNMLSFAPDVFVTLYLHKANQLDAETRRKAYNHFRTGYTNELNYKHSDGSYSAFGSRDPSGSTWLTAFVIKCFLHARELQPHLVEESIVNDGIDFLVNQQDPSGVFNEPGRVSHTAMQGGVNSPVTMTAYVLVTLRETNFAYRSRSVQQASDRARAYLESRLDSIKKDKYALSIVTYALHLAESSRANEALQALELLATIEGGMKYWAEPDAEMSTYSSRWRPPYYKPPTDDVEMTAYALLTYVRIGNVAGSAPIMKWLGSQQNEYGGYVSTQDTVIAIQAMSQVAGLIVGRHESLVIDASHSNYPGFEADVTITPANSMVLNQISVPGVDGLIQIRGTGVGVGVAQLSVCYNVPEGPFQGEAYDCTSDVVSSSSKKARVDFCCQLKPNSNATGMFLFEVGLANGFDVDVDVERERNREAKLVELDDDSVNVYYDDLSPGQTRCANVELLRYADVAKSKPQPLVAFDYYKPDRKVSKLLSIRAFEETDACTVCGSECVGCPGPRLSDWGPWSKCTLFCGSEIAWRERRCTDPNNGDVLDYSMCPTNEITRETRPCAKEGFPCPGFSDLNRCYDGIGGDADLSDGLWYDFPYAFGRPTGRICSLRNRRLTSRTSSIPGTKLIQDNRPSANKAYFTCSVPAFDQRFASTTGFSISLLTNLARVQSGRNVILISFGKDTNTVFEFAKPWWTSKYSFAVYRGRKLFRVINIPTSALPLNQWSHVVLSYNDTLATVHINGSRVGQSTMHSSYRAAFIPKSAKLTIGAKDSNNWFRQGAVRGSFAAFNYWARSLTADEISSLAAFYRPMIGPNNANPLLGVRQLRHFAPTGVKTCFKTTWTLESLYRSPSPCSATPPQPPTV